MKLEYRTEGFHCLVEVDTTYLPEIYVEEIRQNFKCLCGGWGDWEVADTSHD